jgi:hypothetical protein
VIQTHKSEVQVAEVYPISSLVDCSCILDGWSTRYVHLCVEKILLPFILQGSGVTRGVACGGSSPVVVCAMTACVACG